MDTSAVASSVAAWRIITTLPPSASAAQRLSESLAEPMPTVPARTAAEQMASEALQMKKTGRLGDAADIMEEAFNKWPQLRGKYANQVKLWRCGISM
jgi:hypothetical protein